MLSINEILTSLAKQRPVFHSEADFQHALAWEIHQRCPDASIRLERPISSGKGQLHIDLVVVIPEMCLALELKYKTRPLSCRLGDEQFNLTSHGAEDCGRYDFIKDIERLEHVVANEKNAMGMAVLLTNEHLYWTEPSRGIIFDKDFRLHENRVLRGNLCWDERAGKGTTHAREMPLCLTGSYPLRWEDYSRVGGGSGQVFRYLAVNVGR